MPVISVTPDPDALTLTVVAEFAATTARVWDAYADPRQLERFWGPPGWPARFSAHDLRPGGRSAYVMTGPDGATSPGLWEFVEVTPGHSFEFVNLFANDDGTPNLDMPTTLMHFTFEALGADRSRVTTTTRFASLADLEQLIGLGMAEGIEAAMGQIDDTLADLAAFSADRGLTHDLLSDTQVRFTRVIRGSVEQVWHAHHDPAMLRRWMLGPDGWHLPVCDVATEVGQTYRYIWESDDGANRFGFTGELLISEPPTHTVTTERMVDTDGPTTTNALTLTPVAGGTLLTLVVTYPDATTRDTILATGMADGMETSYARLETSL